MNEFRLGFHWSSFRRFELTIFQHWFRSWLGADQAASHYLNHWWLVYWRIYASLGLNELNILLKTHRVLTEPLCTNLLYLLIVLCVLLWGYGTRDIVGQMCRVIAQCTIPRSQHCQHATENYITYVADSKGPWVGSTSIWHRSDTKVSDRCLIDVDLRVVAGISDMWVK